MIEDILPRKTVIADGVLTEVAFDFEVVNADYIKVYLNGVLQNSGWSLSDNKIIFTSAPSANTTITVIRDLPVNYISPIKARGALTSDKIDEHLSEMTAKVQTLSEKISRVPTYPVDTLLTGEQITEDFLEKFQKSSDNLASISEAKDEVVTAKVDGIKALNDETARLTAQVANAIDGKVDTAENAATSAENFAETSKQWAIKMDGKVANEDFSAKYYANQAQISASLTKLNDKLTNCLLNVPQDIKLELNDGTLTLKAGSKVYVPKGLDGTTPKFDYVTVETDVNINKYGTGNTDFFLCYDFANNSLLANANTNSGNTEITSEGFNYNTSTNKITFYGITGSIVSQNVSFPIALCSRSSGTPTSLKYVFNGFGYIGNTAFTLPDVKGLIPNGRNADGSLKNIEFTTTSVLTFTVTSSNIPIISVDSNNIIAWGSLTYDAVNNINKTGDGVIRSTCLCGYLEADSTGRITSFNPKLPVKLADDQEVVHKTGNETIEGEKIFTSNITVSNPNGVSIMQCVDPANTNNNAKIQYYDGDSSATFSNVQNSSTIGGIRIDNSGYAYSLKPPVAGDNSNEIATTNWCYDPAKSTNLVHRSGNETIGGNKIFSGLVTVTSSAADTAIAQKNLNDTSGVAPSTQQLRSFRVMDKNNYILGDLRVTHSTDFVMTSILARNKKSDGTHVNADIRVLAYNNGTISTYAPTPAASSNTTHIATTAWVKGRHQVVSTLPASPDANTFYYIPED